MLITSNPARNDPGAPSAAGGIESTTWVTPSKPRSAIGALPPNTRTAMPSAAASAAALSGSRTVPETCQPAAFSRRASLSAV